MFLRGGRNCGDLAPGAEGTVASGPIVLGGETMTAKLEVVVDPSGHGRRGSTAHGALT